MMSKRIFFIMRYNSVNIHNAESSTFEKGLQEKNRFVIDNAAEKKDLFSNSRIANCVQEI